MAGEVVRHATVYQVRRGEPWKAGEVYTTREEASEAATVWVSENPDAAVHVVGIVDTSGGTRQSAAVAALVDTLNAIPTLRDFP